MNSSRVAWAAVWVSGMLGAIAPWATAIPMAQLIETWESRFSSPSTVESVTAQPEALTWQPENQPPRRSSSLVQTSLLSRVSPWVNRRHLSLMPPVVTVQRVVTDQRPQADTLLASHVQSLQLCPIESQAAAIPYAASTVYQVSVKGQPIAEVLTRSEATRLAQTFRRMLQQSNFDPQQIQPTRLNGLPAGLAEQTPLFVIHDAQAKVYGRSSDLIAINWVNNLREALEAPPLSLHKAQMTMDGLLSSPLTLKGTASWYGPYFHRRLTANGERFNQMALTAAHKTLPFNTFLRVTNVKTQQSVVVRINDRGPYVGDRSLDLSWQAARCIGGEDAGLVTYQAEILDEGAEAIVPAEPISLDQPALMPRVAGSLRGWGNQSID